MKATRRIRLSVIAAVLVFPLASRAGNLVITPTTTLAAETANNTSAATSFVTQSNGNLGATNVSKLDVHSLLYPGAQTKVFAHLVLWFGKPSHINIGYSSTDPAQVKRQISDMISRGIDGVVMVWYGPNNEIDRAAKLVMHEAETHPGFTFAIMVDSGAIRWYSCPGCSPQQALTYDLQYVEQTYFPSPAYLRVGGRPVVTNFDVDLHYTVDWSAAKAALATNPMFLFQHSRGFSHVESAGAYSWDIATSSDFGMSYLTSFYKTGMAAPGDQTWGASYKGFNDKLASWGLNRIMDQRCGQTWLQTFAKINSLYNSTNQLAAMQLVTWNDYEEGTEIESGIDNCVSVSAAMAGNSLQWKITGNENTIDHYRVYVSSDGQNLMPLADQTVGTNALDLCGYSLAAGNYKLFVQAIGKPSLKNQISAPSTLCTTMRRHNLFIVCRPSGKHSRHASGDFDAAASVRFGNFTQRLTIVGHDRGRTVGKSTDHGNRTIKVRRPHRALLFRSPGCDVVRLLSVRDYSGGAKPRPQFSESPLCARHIVRSLCPGRLAGVPWSVSGWGWLECLCLARLTGNAFSAAWLSAA